MAHIILWNAIARRRRSISDTFYDNGLATLRGYLQERGHSVEIIDWARDDFFQALSPLFLSRCLRALYCLIFGKRIRWLRKPVGLLTLPLQAVLSAIQSQRLKKHLKRLVEHIKKQGVYVVGVKLWYGEAFRNACVLAELLREQLPQILTICGGYHTTLYEEYLFRRSSFDLGVTCEGEFPLEAILNIVQRHEKSWDKQIVLNEVVAQAENNAIENLIYRKNGQIYKTRRRQLAGHSSKTIPKYTIDDNKVKVHVMVESLGCDWGRCNFCVHPYFYPHYCLRSPDEIVREIEAMLKIGIGVFRFAGSDTPPAFGAKIGQKILERKLPIIFGMGSRPIKGAAKSYDSLVANYSTLIQAGMRAVFMGSESGNDFINTEVMNKGVVADDIIVTVTALREAQKRSAKQVFLSLALIYPPPLLGKVSLDEVRRDNITLLDKTKPDSVMVTPPGPFLHTRWYEQQKHFGFEVDKTIIYQAMEYEYVLYKPPRFWPDLGIKLGGKPFSQILEECGEFRKYIEEAMTIPTDISDEHFLMFYSAGIREKDSIFAAKNDTMLDIISCDYSFSRKLSKRVNAFNQALSDAYLSGSGE